MKGCLSVPGGLVNHDQVGVAVSQVRARRDSPGGLPAAARHHGPGDVHEFVPDNVTDQIGGGRAGIHLVSGVVLLITDLGGRFAVVDPCWAGFLIQTTRAQQTDNCGLGAGQWQGHMGRVIKVAKSVVMQKKPRANLLPSQSLVHSLLWLGWSPGREGSTAST